MFRRLRDFCDEWQTTVAELILICVLIGVGIALLLAVLQPSSPHYLLSKTDWTCTQTRVEKHVRLQATGKVSIPISTTKENCISYKRNY